jgi:hypothetical protein
VAFTAIGILFARQVVFQLDREVFMFVVGTTVLAAAVALFRTVRTGASIRRGSTWALWARETITPATALHVLTACAVWWPLIEVSLWFKTHIPQLNPFYLDPLLSEIDALLHFGHQPGVWLVSLLPTPLIRMVDSIYFAIYTPLAFVVFYVIGAFDRGRRKLQILLSLVLVWIVIGTLLATLLSSVGPCYFALTYPELPNPYAPLMYRLTQIHLSNELFALRGQDLLWAGHNGLAKPLGISAMPSVHVAVATLTVLCAREFSRIGFFLAVPYYVLILIGSVVTGFHYAIDGYVSTLVVLAIWWGAGRFARWWSARSGVPPQVARTERSG